MQKSTTIITIFRLKSATFITDALKIMQKSRAIFVILAFEVVRLGVKDKSA
jgi:hypothetical protein